MPNIETVIAFLYRIQGEAATELIIRNPQLFNGLRNNKREKWTMFFLAITGKTLSGSGNKMRYDTHSYQRNIKLFFPKIKGMFFTSLLTYTILLVYFVTFCLGSIIIRDSFTSNFPNLAKIIRKL